MEDICAICQSPNNYDVHITSCCHKFHIDCFRQYMNYNPNSIKCPTCRTDLNSNILLEGCCAICKDIIFNDIHVGNCGHEFHIGCFNRNRRLCNICYARRENVHQRIILTPEQIQERRTFMQLIQENRQRETIINQIFRRPKKRSETESKRKTHAELMHESKKELFFPKSRSK